MLRLILVALLSVGLGALGCDTSSEAGGTGGTGGTMIFEPGPSCTAFCEHAAGECEVTELGGDAACKQNCELERSLAQQTSEACLEAFDASVDCAAALDCQDIIDRVNQVNPGAYPCRQEIESSDIICTQG